MKQEVAGQQKADKDQETKHEDNPWEGQEQMLEREGEMHN